MSLVGTWDLKRQENFETVLKELGAGMIARKNAMSLAPVFIFDEEDGLFTIRQQTAYKISSANFRLGEEFEFMFFLVLGNEPKYVAENAGEGLLIKSTATPACEILLEVVDGELNMMIKVPSASGDGKDSKRVFVRRP